MSETDKSTSARQITPRQPTHHFCVFFSDFGVAATFYSPQGESATFYSPLKKNEKPTVAIFRTGLPVTFFCCRGLRTTSIAFSGLLRYCFPQPTRFKLVAVPILPLSRSRGQHMGPFPKTLTFTCIWNPFFVSDFVEHFESTIPLSRFTVCACPACLPPSHQTICPFCRCRRCIACAIWPQAFPLPSTTSSPAGKHSHV